MCKSSTSNLQNGYSPRESRGWNEGDAGERKKRLQNIAKLEGLNADANDLPSVWDTARGGAYPLHRSAIQKELLDKTYGVITAADAWKENGTTPLGRHPNFPTKVPYLRPLSAVQAEAGHTDLSATIIESLKVLLAPTVVKVDIYKPLLITDSTGCKCILQALWVLKKPHFVGQCMFYAFANGDRWTEQPLELPLTCGISAETSSSICTLSDWARRHR